MANLIERHREQIEGVLSGSDRVVIQGNVAVGLSREGDGDDARCTRDSAVWRECSTEKRVTTPLESERRARRGVRALGNPGFGLLRGRFEFARVRSR